MLGKRMDLRPKEGFRVTRLLSGWGVACQVRSAFEVRLSGVSLAQLFAHLLPGGCKGLAVSFCYRKPKFGDLLLA
jgi:hypothetical protein